MLKACDPIGIHDNIAVISPGTGERKIEERKERLLEGGGGGREVEEWGGQLGGNLRTEGGIPGQNDVRPINMMNHVLI